MRMRAVERGHGGRRGRDARQQPRNIWYNQSECARTCDDCWTAMMLTGCGRDRV